MLLLKTCPRCRGDLHLRSDLDGKFLSCIQCGYARDLPGKTATPKEKPAVLRGRPPAEAHAV